MISKVYTNTLYIYSIFIILHFIIHYRNIGIYFHQEYQEYNLLK